MEMLLFYLSPNAFGAGILQLPGFPVLIFRLLSWASLVILLLSATAGGNLFNFPLFIILYFTSLWHLFLYSWLKWFPLLVLVYGGVITLFSALEYQITVEIAISLSCSGKAIPWSEFLKVSQLHTREKLFPTYFLLWHDYLACSNE